MFYIFAEIILTKFFGNDEMTDDNSGAAEVG